MSTRSHSASNFPDSAAMPGREKLNPASSTTGFFQNHPSLSNQLDEDEVLRRCMTLFAAPSTLAAVQPMLSSFADAVITPQIFTWIADAERNTPFLKGNGFTALGHPNPDSLVTTEGWRTLQALGIREGIVATGYEADAHGGVDCRVIQMLKLHMWCASSAYVACPSAMQDGAAAVLRNELVRINKTPYSAFLSSDFLASESRVVFARALERLKSRDPSIAWTSGQWMTERAGGSDVSGTETIASWMGPGNAADDGTDIDGLPLGPWRIDGFKWFSSATDCGMTILLAQTAKGVSCFFAPTRKLVRTPDGARVEAMNGVRIQRLKNKLGTRALPTSELELKGMRAWLVGEEGEGVKVISAMLTVTRAYNATTAMGHLGRGLAIVRAYAAVRTFPSRPDVPLSSLPLFAKTAATLTRRYRSSMMLTFLVAALLGASEYPSVSEPFIGGTSPVRPPVGSLSPARLNGLIPSSPTEVLSLLRVLTPIAKARTAKVGIAGLQECMEALGGVGYCENEENQEMNVARLYRDANVLSIWEGTTDVMATDLVKVITGRDARRLLDALDAWIGVATRGKAMAEEKGVVQERWKSLRKEIESKQRDQLMSEGRAVMEQLGDVVCGTLMLADVERDGDDAAAECCRLFVSEQFHISRKQDWGTASRWDGRIAFGAVERVREKL